MTASGTPDFFFDHFDLAAAAELPVPEDADALPVWTDLMVKLSQAPYITIGSIRGRTGSSPRSTPRPASSGSPPGACGVR